MQAVWFEKNGPAAEVLQCGERPTPAPGPGEVRVRVAVSGVNPSDVKRRMGSPTQKLAFPWAIPNNDGAGVIDAVGPGVDVSRVGERVWLHSTGWLRPLGTAAEYTVTPSARAFRLPDVTSFEVGAGLGVPAMTAHRAVFGCGSVTGKTVLVTGGAGAVGFYAIQLALRGGARVIATVSGADKAAEARRAGAHEVVNYKSEDVVARVKALTGEAGVDHIVEVDFGANLKASVALLKNSGSLATYASMAAPEPVIPFYPMMFKNLQLLWVFVYEMPQSAMEAAARDISDWLTSGTAQHPRYHHFRFDQAIKAHQAVEAAVTGKVVIDIASP